MALRPLGAAPTFTVGGPDLFAVCPILCRGIIRRMSETRNEENPADNHAGADEGPQALSADPSRSAARLHLDANGDLWDAQGQYVGNIHAKSGVAGALQHMAQPPRVES